MADDDWYKPRRPPAPKRQAQPGELLFEFYVERTKKFYRCELRDLGEYGVEAQFFDPVEIVQARTFSPHLDPIRSPRVMAIAWATEERKRSRPGNDRRPVRRTFR